MLRHVRHAARLTPVLLFAALVGTAAGATYAGFGHHNDWFVAGAELTLDLPQTYECDVDGQAPKDLSRNMTVRRYRKIIGDAVAFRIRKWQAVPVSTLAGTSLPSRTMQARGGPR